MNHECMMNLHTVYDESSDMLHHASFILTRELGEVKHLKPRRERDLVISRRVWGLIHVDLLLKFQSKVIQKRLCYLISQVQLQICPYLSRYLLHQPSGSRWTLWRLFLKGLLLSNRQSCQWSRYRIML
jgi:hypothetical protein